MTHGEKVRAFVIGVNVYTLPTAGVFHFAPDWELWEKLLAVPIALVSIVMIGFVLAVLG